MTTLISTGSLFSNWQETFEKQLAADSSGRTEYAGLSSLTKDIIRQQFTDSDELGWKPFTVDNQYSEKASLLFSNVKKGDLLAWNSSNNCFILDFWEKTAKDANFVLFYSSPEFELSNYINQHSFDAERIKLVIDSWLIRTKAMLTFFMNNRERSVLVNAQSAHCRDELFMQVINKQFDMNLEPPRKNQTSLNKSAVLIEYLATTLLLKHRKVAELYDEVLSTATQTDKADNLILSIENRSEALIETYLAEVHAHQQIRSAKKALDEELSFMQLQIKQLTEELELTFKNSIEQEKIANTMTQYLSDDPLLKITRWTRQAQ